MRISRRDTLALIPAAAALAAGSGPALAALPAGDDARLLQLCARFDRELAEQTERYREWMAAKDAAEAEPECPKVPNLDTVSFDEWRAAHMARLAFVGQRERETCNASNAAHERMGATIRAVFATPALTAAGVLAKVRLLQLAKDAADSWEQDHDLICYEPEPNAWFGSVVADLERIAGGAS